MGSTQCEHDISQHFSFETKELKVHPYSFTIICIMSGYGAGGFQLRAVHIAKAGRIPCADCSAPSPLLRRDAQ